MIDELWSITPQAQLTYSSVNFDDFRDLYGANVRRTAGRTFEGRLGLALDYENAWKNNDGKVSRTHAYTIANLYYDFDHRSGTMVDAVHLSTHPERLSAGLGVGLSHNWNDDQFSLYAEGLISSSMKDFGDNVSYKGTLGFKVRW